MIKDTQTLCCWFSIQRLCDLLGVAVATAKCYQNGKAKPRPGEITLLRLLYDGKIMPESWPGGMKFRGDLLTTPNELESLTWKEIETYRWVLGQWHWSNQKLVELERKLSLPNS
ncbi:hypothetical protein [uncultured Pseudoteredinibacter sp.]|uniref:hypothetical protein n=1 Tax=uncultured Pseudoteredinibacter sp. TaxID=1641701 RepID=UPI00262A105B|nr:hypothetical protein [uncultured Pseudoteredinibacter sp.]